MHAFFERSERTEKVLTRFVLIMGKRSAQEKFLLCGKMNFYCDENSFAEN
jgi:hypothetical protein